MYVFVDIGVDVRHLVATVVANFPPGTNLALAGTIQFGSSIQVHADAVTMMLQVLHWYCCSAAGQKAACRPDYMIHTETLGWSGGDCGRQSQCACHRQHDRRWLGTTRRCASRSPAPCRPARC